jgi:hypothetical protein
MTAIPPSAIAGQAPFEVHAIHFDFPNGDAISLRDPAGNTNLGAMPEWMAAPSRCELAAYVRGLRPHIRVTFHGAVSANGDYIVGADGIPSQIGEQKVTLAFDPGSGCSAPVTLRLSVPLPDEIGVHAAKFNWYVRDPSDPTICLPVGTSVHSICTTWRAMVPNPAQQLSNWMYGQLMEWTCDWATGRVNEKEICDAIIANLKTSGLQYGVLNVHDVPGILQSGGGMCEGWYQMFQQMAHCQGIFIHRRRFLVDWRLLPSGEDQWCALVIRSGGLNQPKPTHGPSEFHDNDTAFPLPTSVPLATQVERRYRFWGEPGNWYDGHCVNFLEYNGRLYLYDACFGLGPVEIDAPLPPDDFSVIGGPQLASFKARYLDGAVDYMLGSLYNGPGGALVRSIASLTNGMTVKTTLIPDVVHRNPGLTFFWGG